MDLMEDELKPMTEAGRFASLALVSTGEGLRSWMYYARSGDEFVDRLNLALDGKPIFPIEIDTENDPTWSMYRKFKDGVKEPSS